MTTIDMGLNTSPDFRNVDELVARFEANGNYKGAEDAKRRAEEAAKLRDKIAETVEREGECELNWSCTGATLFDILASNWSVAMPEYKFTIRRYYCHVAKR